jgi:hypothetical protein
MLGQTPFVGYALVDFAPDAEPEPAIDTGLLRGSTEEPEWFVALGSAQPVRLDDYALVQLPLTATLAAGERSLPGSAMAPPPALEKELSKREAWIRELEARAATADERADAVQDEVEELTACLVSLGLPERPSPDELGALRQRLGSTADANEAAAKAAEDLALARAELVEARALLASREDELRSLRELDGSGEADELDALERQLGERAQRIREVERALAEAERFGRELIVELGQVAQIRAPSAAEPAPAPAPSELSARAARAEADLMAATWAIGELEWRLAAQQSKEPNAAALEDKLECLEGELARQAVLLEQANSGRPA